MDRLTTITNQQTIAGVAREVTTKDGRFTIRFPLAKNHTTPVTLHCGPTSRLSALRTRMNALLNDGHPVICPLSGERIQVYRRHLTRSQVRTLERLRDKSDKLGKTYLHLEFFSARRDGDLAKLAAWGLAEPMKPATALEDEKWRGHWKITARGRQWLAGTVTIPRQMALLLGECLGPVNEADQITAAQVPEVFDRDALLTDSTKPVEAACP